MLPGGDLYEREEGFFRLVQSRAEDTVEKWLGSLTCPVIRIDGTKSVEENMAFVMEQMGKNQKLSMDFRGAFTPREFPSQG